MRSLLVLVAVTIMAAVASVQAEPRSRPDRGLPEGHHGEHAGLSVKEAASRAQRQHGGRVLSVDPDESGGYRVKLLKDGEVRTVFIAP